MYLPYRSYLSHAMACTMEGKGGSVAERLPDGSEKPGEGLCAALRRTCNGQREQVMIKGTDDESPRDYIPSKLAAWISKAMLVTCNFLKMRLR